MLSVSVCLCLSVSRRSMKSRDRAVEGEPIKLKTQDFSIVGRPCASVQAQDQAHYGKGSMLTPRIKEDQIVTRETHQNPTMLAVPAGAATRVLTCCNCSLPSTPAFCIKNHMDSPPRSLNNTTILSSASHAPETKSDTNCTGDDYKVTLQEWQGWGSISQLPRKVMEITEDLKLLERNIDTQMNFGGNGGKLQGKFGLQEDKKHRAAYQVLHDSEKKLQFFSARQIACRFLGSRGYLCQRCWLPLEEDCMCSKIKPCSLWHGIRFWVYMHPKDFLRQNNTGKLLWQVFGVQSATLCLFGIAEDEEIMWNEFKLAGKEKVWCLYPNKNAVKRSVQDAFYQESSANVECTMTMTNEDKPFHFVLIDGTWSNSAAMFNRLKEKMKSFWGEEDLPCISLSTGVSRMHKLRPQPSWDHTCTAAAAIGLLTELQRLPGFSSCGLDEQTEALEDAIDVLLEALTARRLRMGRSITRKVRHRHDIC